MLYTYQDKKMGDTSYSNPIFYTISFCKITRLQEEELLWGRKVLLVQYDLG